MLYTYIYRLQNSVENTIAKEQARLLTCLLARFLYVWVKAGRRISDLDPDPVDSEFK